MILIVSCLINLIKKGLTTPFIQDDDDDVYLDKLQTRGVKESISYM
jgi:hypothetical protein